jgi:enoyl-CoA hydratase
MEVNMKIELNKVIFEEKEDIGYVVINDPPANKMTTLFLTELSELVTRYIAHSKVKGIIITGNGRHYSSGVEVDRLKELVSNQASFDSDGNLVTYPMGHQQDRNSFDFFYNHNIPVISAINGFCIGAGLELALCSHIRICGNGSTLGLPESTFGFIPALSGTLRCVELCGLGKALELVLSGETFSAEDALKMGIVDGIVSKKETLSYCEELMKYILQSKMTYSKTNIKMYLKNFNEIYLSIKNKQGRGYITCGKM